MPSFLQIPDSCHYWLCNVRIPTVLLTPLSKTLFESLQRYEDRLVAADIEVTKGRITSLRFSGLRFSGLRSAGLRSAGLRSAENVAAESAVSAASIDAKGGLVWPCFVDMHTHLDKGHIWSRSPNPDGTFSGALETVKRDSSRRWDTEDVYRRAEFGLKCSYAHGTQAIRTHLDAFGEQGEISFDVFRQLREAWQERVKLQAVCLVTLDYFVDEKGEKLADLVASSGAVLGGVAFTNADIIQQIDRVFELAKERSLDLDFHTDESLDPEDENLRYVAEAAIRHDFQGAITCGHCCSLSVQSEDVSRQTIELVKEAGISVVSLPMCNLYLQNREAGRTPRYRGVTLLRELKTAGVDVAIASDNCRDPFFAYGDHDGLEVFKQSVRIGHLDHPIGEWPQAITSAPAKMMGLDGVGCMKEGMSADLVIFKARSFNELMARDQSDRVIIRAGKQIDTTLPDYAELDDLMH